jgi:hypothetical protein
VPDYVVKGDVTYGVISDYLGSVRLVVNTADGSIAQQLEYDEFGAILLDTNPGFQPFGYLIRRTKGLPWWMPLYFTGARSIESALAEWAPEGCPIADNI